MNVLSSVSLGHLLCQSSSSGGNDGSTYNHNSSSSKTNSSTADDSHSHFGTVHLSSMRNNPATSFPMHDMVCSSSSSYVMLSVKNDHWCYCNRWSGLICGGTVETDNSSAFSSSSVSLKVRWSLSALENPSRGCLLDVKLMPGAESDLVAIVLERDRYVIELVYCNNGVSSSTNSERPLHIFFFPPLASVLLLHIVPFLSLHRHILTKSVIDCTTTISSTGSSSSKDVIMLERCGQNIVYQHPGFEMTLLRTKLAFNQDEQSKQTMNIRKYMEKYFLGTQIDSISQHHNLSYDGELCLHPTQASFIGVDHIRSDNDDDDDDDDLMDNSESYSSEGWDNKFMAPNSSQEDCSEDESSQRKNKRMRFTNARSVFAHVALPSSENATFNCTDPYRFSIVEIRYIDEENILCVVEQEQQKPFPPPRFLVNAITGKVKQVADSAHQYERSMIHSGLGSPTRRFRAMSNRDSPTKQGGHHLHSKSSRKRKRSQV